MKIWFISDTHTKHQDLIIEDVDMVIHSGDVSSSKDNDKNRLEVINFLEWYRSLKIKHKILISGNHDTSISDLFKNNKELFLGIDYLEHHSINIEGINIFGSPYTPKFGHDWAFNLGEEIEEYWLNIPKDTDILVTHGPPKGILDLTKFDSRAGADGKSFYQCGCKFLLNQVKIIEPKYHVFGHIHTEEECPNSGMLKIQNLKTTFINASVCNFKKGDGKYLINNGFIVDYI